MTARGEGGAKDPAVAYVWLALAAKSGQKEAGAARDLLAPSLSAEERKRAEAVLAPKVASAQ
jgi:TPR repeat protein